MFYGEYEHTLDDKGRFIVPIRFRDYLEEGCFMTRGLDGCLWIFTVKDYETLWAQIQTMNQFEPEARKIARMFTGADMKLDKQGRLLIPPSMRSHAGIEPGADIIIVGVQTQSPRIEVWNAERWNTFNAELQAGDSATAEALARKGFKFS